MQSLLATRAGRLATFFFLYLTEGIPLGFAATAAATVLRREGVGPADIGAFVGSLYLPWAFKWAVGPFVDIFYSDKLGRRRTWILAAQGMMTVTLLMTTGASLPSELKLFTLLIIIHNIFGATQDVAIDALAVGSLSTKERGLANGVMFAAAYLGQAVGGSAVLYMLDAGMSFTMATVIVAATIFAVTLFVVIPMREPKDPHAPSREGQGLASVIRELQTFAAETWRGFASHRGSTLAVIFALLPPGAMSLGLALQSNVSVELGLTDSDIATLTLWSTVLSAAGCLAGGYLSDIIGRRRALAIYIPLMSIPVLYLAWLMQNAGWIMPVDTTLADRPLAESGLITGFWIATLSYSVFNGLMYGTRTALFMDVTNPAVAATQFTAYMALLNLTINYSANWQGQWIETFGYPSTLLVDAVFGLVCLLILPFIKPRPTNRE